MILSDREIESALDEGQIIIDPRPDPVLWTSTAIDLTLHEGLSKWNECKPSASGQGQGLRPFGNGFNIKEILEDRRYTSIITIDDHGYSLGPGQFVLGYTLERIYLPNKSRIAARVEGKSSLARLGVGVHVTAPTIHAGFGFNPQKPASKQVGLRIQLEIFNIGNQIIILDKSMPICQLILEEVRETPKKGYIGRFSEQESFTEDDKRIEKKSREND